MPNYPLISGVLVLNGGRGDSSAKVPFDHDTRKTEAEVTILMHVHGLGADATVDEILEDARWTGEVEIDEASLRAELEGKYGRDLVQTLFPYKLPEQTAFPDKRAEWAEKLRKAKEAEAAAHKQHLDRLQDAADEAADMAPEPEIAAEPGSKAALQTAYTALTGKKPFNGWDEAALREKIAEASAPPQVAATEPQAA